MNTALKAAGVLLAVAVVSGTSQSAFAAELPTEGGGASAVVSEARDIIVDQTGDSASPITSTVKASSGQDISVAETPSGEPLTTLIQDQPGEGTATLAVLEQGQTEADFKLDIPEGMQLAYSSDGGLNFVTTDEPASPPISAYEAPWAVDAEGRSLPTHYVIIGTDTVRQVTDTTDATFPVVVDPKYKWAWYGPFYVHYTFYSKKETQSLANNMGTATAFFVAACSFISNPAGKAACSAYFSINGANTVRLANEALQHGQCLTNRVGITGGIFNLDPPRLLGDLGVS